MKNTDYSWIPTGKRKKEILRHGADSLFGQTPMATLLKKQKTEILSEMYPRLKIDRFKQLTSYVKWFLALLFLTSLTFILYSCVNQQPARAEEWLTTAYCSCAKCCGKSDGITASGHKLIKGDKVVACNWLPFGTKVNIQGLGVFIVMDRGARSLFGSKNNHIKHLDIYMTSHNAAQKFGVKYAKVEVLK